MKKFISEPEEALAAARTRDWWSLAGIRCALLLLLLFGGGVAALAQQVDPLTITPEGKVGIGTPSPGNKLSVNGNADVSGNFSVAGNAQVSGTVGIGTSDLGTSKFKIASSADFAHFRFATAGGGEFEMVGWGNGWNINTRTTGKILYLNRDTSSDVWIGPFGKEMVVKGDTGRVGVGTNSPGQQFDIFSSNSDYGMLRVNNNSASSGEASIGFFDTNARNGNNAWVAGVGAWGNTGNFVIGNNGAKFLIDKSGNVGIGTTSPGKGKLEISGTSSGDKPGFSYLKWLNPGGVNTGGSPNEALSIYASGSIGAAAVFVFSDERIKKIRGRSDGARDLDTLLAIEITDYDFGDAIGKGRAPHKKVIGQQVEKVFPEAVTRSTDVVPDIYQKAAIKESWVMLATNLKKGDRVRLISEKQEGIHEVLEAAQGKFRTAFAPEGDQVFVYGREVKDFRSVDYDAISMLNVSATQQIKKEKDAEVKALQEENAALRRQLVEQEKRLAAIEALLLSPNQPTVSAASLKTIKQSKQ